MKPREIGSEFWDVPICERTSSFFPEYIQWFLSGRSALQAIIRELEGVRSVSIPSWCCESMVKPFIDAGIKVQYYPVYWLNSLVQEIRLDSDVLFLMDYFGYTTETHDLKNYKGIIIRDVTHSIFSAAYSDADYYFGSLRKWCGVWSGGFAWTKDNHSLPLGQGDDYDYIAIRKEAMVRKNGYIHGKDMTDKGYLRLFCKAEEILSKVGTVSAPDRDVNLAYKLDVEGISQRRRNNANILREVFPDWLIFSDLKKTDTPMFVPVIIPAGKRDELRRYLIDNDIYCPVHWPVSKYHKMDERTERLYKNELSLVCDQRYNSEDMIRMAETIKHFMGEE